MADTYTVDYQEVTGAAGLLAERWRVDTHHAAKHRLTHVYGIPRGGCVPATIVAALLDLELADTINRLDATDDMPGRHNTLIVDDLVDSGNTLAVLNSQGWRTDALFRKSHSPTHLAPLAHHLTDDWLVFPWELVEAERGPEENVVRLLQYLGEDPQRAGLLDTPKRVVKALQEMTSGHSVDIEAILGRVFDDPCDEMVTCRGIEFTSLCEHHMLPFTGVATVSYVPTDKVVGLSKLARLVDAFAMRLQVQERLTQQIAAALEEHVHPKGVGVLITAKHSCMGCRGVRKPGAEMVTSALTGLMKDDPKARAEFLALATG